MNWLHWPYRNGGSAARAFCFPYAGAGVSAFSGWAPRLRRDLLELCVVVPPGREVRYREAPLTQMGPLAEAAAQAILPHLDRPFVLLGHSFGALVAFEVARVLRRSKARMPEMIFVSAAPAPQCPWPHKDLHLLSDSRFITELGRLYGEISPLILEDAELLSIVLPAMRADLTVVETYEYAADRPLDCPISAFTGRSDTAIQPALVNEWKYQTSGEFRLHEMVGDHFFVRSQPDEMVRIVLADMRETGRGALLNSMQGLTRKQGEQ